MSLAGCLGQPLPCSGGEVPFLVAVRPDLTGQGAGTFEMEADAGVRLGHRGAKVFEPAGVALVEASSSRLRQGFVGRVADELVTEPNGFFPG